MGRIVIGALTLEPSQEAPDAPIKLTWLGKSIDRAPAETLHPFMTKIVEEARANRVPLELHFEHLERLNSSTVAYVVTIVQHARENDVRLVVVFDAAIRWQKLSLGPLEALKTDERFDVRPLS